MTDWYKSRKFWLTVVGAAFQACGMFLPIPLPVLIGVGGTLAVGTLAFGIADAGKAAAKEKNADVAALVEQNRRDMERLEATVKTALNNPQRFRP